MIPATPPTPAHSFSRPACGPCFPRPKRHWILATAVSLTLLPLASGDAPPKLPYTQNFESLPEGPPPADMLAMNGTYTVKKSDGNAFLEMAPDPLDSNGILFGPADQSAYAISARIRARSSGKRMPEFGVGANGPGVYRLWIMPAVGEVQLIKAEDVKAAKPFPWKTNTWTHLKLQVRKPADGKTRIEGKAWPEGQPEPKDWTLSWDDPEPPSPGRAGVYATPYAGTPTDFDDITVTRPAP
jgi:hypothetical protein